MPRATPRVKSLPSKSKAFSLQKVFDWVIEQDYSTIQAYVDKFREQNPDLDNDELAEKIVSRSAMKNGLLGALSGLGGLITLPVTVPADVVGSWRIQATMVLAIAYVYGHTNKTTDLKTDLYIVLAFDAAKEALKRAGIAVGKAATRKAVQKYVTQAVMMKIWAVLGRKIISKAGEKSVANLMRMAPLVGAPIGFAFDWAAAKAVGANAIKYYSGRA